MLKDLTFIGVNVVSMVKDDNEINIEGEAGGLGWLPSHNPFHLEQIQRCEQQHHHHCHHHHHHHHCHHCHHHHSPYFQGVLVAGFGSGHLRLFSLPSGRLLAEIAAHNGWITGFSNDDGGDYNAGY